MSTRRKRPLPVPHTPKSVQKQQAAPAAKSSPRAATGKPFQKGQSGNPAGRQPGVPNKATREIKAVVQELFADAGFQAKLKKRFVAMELEPALLVALLHYGFGKPPTSVAVSVNFNHEEYLAALSGVA